MSACVTSFGRTIITFMMIRGQEGRRLGHSTHVGLIRNGVNDRIVIGEKIQNGS